MWNYVLLLSPFYAFLLWECMMLIQSQKNVLVHPSGFISDEQLSIAANLYPIATETEEKTDEASETEEACRRYTGIAASIAQLMKEEKLYLKTDLRIQDLAGILGTNRTYVSRALNMEFGCSFFNYVNQQRIEHAQRLIRANPSMTEEQAAAESGFLYASAFSRTFKAQTGLTFREWHKSHRSVPQEIAF